MNSQPIRNIKKSSEFFNKKEKNKKNQKKPKKIKKSLSSKTYLNSSLLSELKSIVIPHSFDEKQKLLLTLKNTIISIDNAVQLLVKKKDYYKEIVQSIEADFEKRNSLISKQALENDKIGMIQEELYSMLLNKFYSLTFTKVIFLTSLRALFKMSLLYLFIITRNFLF